MISILGVLFYIALVVIAGSAFVMGMVLLTDRRGEFILTSMLATIVFAGIIANVSITQPLGMTPGAKLSLVIVLFFPLMPILWETLGIDERIQRAQYKKQYTSE